MTDLYLKGVRFTRTPFSIANTLYSIFGLFFIFTDFGGKKFHIHYIKCVYLSITKTFLRT